MNPLGAVVKALRQAQGVSQVQLAEATGISQTYLSDVEGGKVRLPNVHHRRRLAGVLGTSNVELLLASGEVDEEELIAWARQGGFVREDSIGGEGILRRLAAELAVEDPESARVGLARQIPVMTRQEARFLWETFERLPTEAQAKRQELTPEDYRRWLAIQDTKERVKEVREEL